MEALIFFLFLIFVVVVVRSLAGLPGRKPADKRLQAAIDEAIAELNGQDANEDLPYRLRPSLLTRTELAFYHALKSAVPDFTICPQVRIADIVTVQSRSYTHRNRVTNKHVDFLLCDPQSLKPVLAIELDDYTHQLSSRRERDDFVNAVYKSASLPVLHVTPQSTYDTDTLGNHIRSMLGSTYTQGHNRLVLH